MRDSSPAVQNDEGSALEKVNDAVPGTNRLTYKKKIFSKIDLNQFKTNINGV